MLGFGRGDRQLVVTGSIDLVTTLCDAEASGTEYKSKESREVQSGFKLPTSWEVLQLGTLHGPTYPELLAHPEMLLV